MKDGPASVCPIWVEDIRAVKIKLTEDKVRRGRSAASGTNPLDVRWEISTEERERFMITLPLIMQTLADDVDPHAGQRRLAEFQVDDASDNNQVDERDDV